MEVPRNDVEATPQLTLVPSTSLQRPMVKRHRSLDVRRASKRRNIGTETRIDTSHSIRIDADALADTTITARAGGQLVDLNLDYAPADDDEIEDTTLSEEQRTTDTEEHDAQLARTSSERTETTQVRWSMRVVAAKSGDCFSQRFEKAADYSPMNEFIQRKLREDHLYNAENREIFQQTEIHPTWFLSVPRCIAEHLSRKTPQTKCKYSHSDSKKSYPCDECIAKHRSCIKPARVRGQLEMCVSPDKEAARGCDS